MNPIHDFVSDACIEFSEALYQTLNCQFSDKLIHLLYLMIFMNNVLLVNIQHADIEAIKIILFTQ